MPSNLATTRVKVLLQSQLGFPKLLGLQLFASCLGKTNFEWIQRLKNDQIRVSFNLKDFGRTFAIFDFTLSYLLQKGGTSLVLGSKARL